MKILSILLMLVCLSTYADAMVFVPHPSYSNYSYSAPTPPWHDGHYIFVKNEWIWREGVYSWNNDYAPDPIVPSNVISEVDLSQQIHPIITYYVPPKRVVPQGIPKQVEQRR